MIPPETKAHAEAILHMLECGLQDSPVEESIQQLVYSLGGTAEVRCKPAEVTAVYLIALMLRGRYG